MTNPFHDRLDAIDASDTTGFHGGRLAATVLLLRDGADGLEVWVQERVHTMHNYPGHSVFPGGGVDPRDFPPRSWDSGELWAGKSVISLARRMGVTKSKPTPCFRRCPRALRGGRHPSRHPRGRHRLQCAALSQGAKAPRKPHHFLYRIPQQ